MPAIVAIPTVVEDTPLQFADLFPNEPSRRHLSEFLTGLLIAESKTISGIAREFADAPDQSCLNRWLMKAPWDSTRINAHRLEWLQSDPTTRYRHDGVIAISYTFVTCTKQREPMRLLRLPPFHVLDYPRSFLPAKAA